MYRKYDFTESKNLNKWKSKNNLIDYQNNYVENSNITSNAAKNFDILIKLF